MMDGQVERWGVFEFQAQGPAGGNPFRDVTFSAVFETAGRSVEVRGFYDGDGTYRVRFMPDREGDWRFVTQSNRSQLSGLRGRFTCTPASPENHGPVRVAGESHFGYEDGTPCFIMGTTAYAWTYQPPEVRQRSLESFSKHGFNKIRMLVFPKQYGDGTHIDISADPPWYPYEGKPGAWDYGRFNPAFFRNYEQRVIDLMRLGIEADVILFHPYDVKWRLPQGMSEKDDLFYVEYITARLAACRNVWWSLANEYDLFLAPKWREKDWDRIGSQVAASDPHGHLISVHNWPYVPPYPDRPWLTHVSYQHANTFSMLLDLRRRYRKPVVNDEYQYEGSIPFEWGNCSGELELRRHWMAVMAGGYATHGEVLRVNDSIRDYFWSCGGTLQGQSAPRLAYLRKVVESIPWQQLSVDWRKTDGRDLFCLSREEEFFFYFLTPEFKDRGSFWVGAGHHSPAEYDVVVHDLWACREAARLVYRKGQTRLELPAWTGVVARRRT